MALKHFLYRCPSCGHDPMTGAHDEARCTACGLVVNRNAGGPTCLRVFGAPGFPSSEVPASTLSDRIDAMGGALPRATSPDGTLDYSADVRVRTAGSERPIRYRGTLLGFAERFVTGVAGHLRLDDEALILETGRGSNPRSDPRTPRPPTSAGPASESRTWLLESLASIQTSSSAVQITTADRGIVLFRFVDDSPRRWDELLRYAISRRWELLGRGTVHEFQPRIRVEALRP